MLKIEGEKSMHTGCSNGGNCSSSQDFLTVSHGGYTYPYYNFLTPVLLSKLFTYRI